MVLTQSKGFAKQISTPWQALASSLCLPSAAQMLSNCLQTQQMSPRGKLFQMPGFPSGLPFSLGPWPSNSSLSCQQFDAFTQVFKKPFYPDFRVCSARGSVGLGSLVRHCWHGSPLACFSRVGLLLLLTAAAPAHLPGAHGFSQASLTLLLIPPTSVLSLVPYTAPKLKPGLVKTLSQLKI